MNQCEIAHETGGASDEANHIDVIEDFVHRPPTNCKICAKFGPQNSCFLLKLTKPVHSVTY